MTWSITMGGLPSKFCSGVRRRNLGAPWLIALPVLFTAMIYWVWDKTEFLALVNNILMTWSIFICLVAAVVYFGWRRGDQHLGSKSFLRDPVRIAIAMIVAVAIV